MSDEKKPAPVEKSLGYIAWDVKTIAKQMERLAQTLEDLLKTKKEQSSDFFK